MALQQWLGRFEVGSNNRDFALDDGTNTPSVSLDTGTYYIAGYSGETTNNLVEHIQDKMAAETGFSAATCTYNANSGLVSLGFAATTNVTWTDTDLRDLLGFTADLDSASSYTGTNEAKYVWRPNISLSGHPVTGSRVFEPESTTLVYRARDGTTTSVVGTKLYRAQLEYSMLDEARIIIPSTGTVNREFETFFEDVIHSGQPIRLYFDRTLNTSTDYVTCIVGDGESMISSFSEYAGRHIQNYNGLWNLSIPILKFV